MSDDQNGATLARSLPLAILAMAIAMFVFAMSVGFRNTLDGDAMFFLPQIVQYAKGEGLCNPYYQRTFAYSEAHDGRHIWHGFLYQLLLGGIFRADSYTRIALACSILNGGCLLILAIGLTRISHNLRLPASLVMVFLMLLAAAGFLLGLEGRPESLVAALTSVAVCVAQVQPAVPGSMALGAILGLALVTSPLPAALLGLGVASWGVVTCGLSLRILRLAACAAVGFALATGFGFAVYPYTVHEWLAGLLKHRQVLHHFAILAHWRTWLIYSGHFFLAGILVSGIAGALRLIVCFTEGRTPERLSAIGLLSVSVAGMIYFSQTSGWYVVTGLTPVLMALALGLAVKPRASRCYSPSRLIPLGLAIIFSISALDPLLLGLARLTGWRGMSLTAARQQFRQDFVAADDGVAFSKSLFVLTEQMQGNEVMPYEKYAMDVAIHSDHKWAVIQQWGEPWNRPPAFPGYDLVVDRFSSCRKAPGRLGQWFQPTGFQYAIYRKRSLPQQALQ
jgi:hypothetical protein